MAKYKTVRYIDQITIVAKNNVEIATCHSSRTADHITKLLNKWPLKGNESKKKPVHCP